MTFGTSCGAERVSIIVKGVLRSIFGDMNAVAIQI